MSTHPAARLKALLLPPGERVVAAALEQVGIGRRSGRILWRTVQAFVDDDVARLGAALAFYTTVAVAPLLVLSIAMAGTVFGAGEARQEVIGEISKLAGTEAGAAVAAVQSPTATPTGLLATLLGVGTLIFGGIGVFTNLQGALNTIWRVPPHPALGWWHFLKRRLFSLATVMATGFLLLVSLVASAVLSWLGAETAHRFRLPVLGLEFVNNALSFGVVTSLFALVFRLLPDTRVQLRHVWLGAAVTALLFTVGKSLLGLYLGRASLTSAYGAGGSLLVLLLWCYYVAQIVFLGAEFTRVTALTNGGRDFTPFQDPAERSRPV
ncbi:MAG: YihY/virulence factor BrkB family protein [Verrucomicrobia bacterium]|nr:YihY/virulence factor BrkB family protein [Verrucomicrobiota bacterium]